MFWGMSGQLTNVYESNKTLKRLSAYHKYVIRFKFGKTKKGFDIDNTKIKVEIFTYNEKRMAQFIIGPPLLRKAIATEDGGKELKLVLNLENPLSKIIQIGVNYDGKGALLVKTIEIQKDDWNKANIAFINDYIQLVTEKESGVKNIYPAATQQIRSIEKEVLARLINFEECVPFVWMTINLMPLFCLFFGLCTTKKGINGMSLHFCTDFHDKYFSSATSSVMSAIISSMIFNVTISFYRFAIKPGAIIELGSYSNRRITYRCLYLSTVVIFGFMAAIVAVFHYTNRAKLSDNEKDFRLFWLLAIILAFVIFLLIWIPIMSVIGHFIGFYDRVPVVTKPDNNVDTNL